MSLNWLCSDILRVTWTFHQTGNVSELFLKCQHWLFSKHRKEFLIYFLIANLSISFQNIRGLNCNFEFPLSENVLNFFLSLKDSIKDASLIAIVWNKDFQVETDASNFCLAATLSHEQRPVAFFSRTLSKCEFRHHTMEKEAATIVEALRHWRYILLD